MALPQTNINAFTDMNPPTRDDPADFDPRAEYSWNCLKASQPQFNLLATQVNNMATAANQSATDAAGYRDTAKGYRDTALTYRNSAEGHRNEALGFRNEAETFKNAAAASAAALRGTSASALTIGVGSKSLTTETGRQFGPGVTLKLIVSTNGEAWMTGRVTSYNSSTGALVVNVTAVAAGYAGQGANSWNVYVSGEVGPTGPMGGLSGGTLTGPLNERRTGDVPSAASPDIWSLAGNVVPVTGTNTITNFSAAPQAGSKRTLLVIDSGLKITRNSQLLVPGLEFGGTMALVAGDELEVLALSTTVFRVLVHRYDGTPLVHSQGALHNLRVFGGSGIFYATKTGWHKITAVGPSGSAGVATSPTGHTGATGATGAGAGALASGMRWLTAGVAYVVNVGTGGAAVSLASGPTARAVNGNDGGTTSFSGAGITSLVADGGHGGLATIAAGVSLAGGVGGSAAGAAGDMLVSGGNGGLLQPLSAGCSGATGGGAVGLKGMPMHGGDVQATGTSATACGGGAGVGGRGGNAIASGTANCAACGGGSGGPAADLTNAIGTASQAGYNFQGTNGGGASFQMPNDLDSATGGGGPANAGVDSPAGGGLGGITLGPSEVRAGFFAGAGGYATTSTVYSTGARGGAFGGAPGGVVGTNTSSSGGQTQAPQRTGAAGSSGGVWIEW